MENPKSIIIPNFKSAPWIAVGSLAIGAFALVTTEFLPVGLLPQIASDLNLTHGQTGLMVTIPGFVAAIAALGSIVLAKNSDRRHVLLVLLFFLALSNLIVANATGLFSLLFGRVLLGIAVGSFWTLAGSLGPKLRPGNEGIKASALILSGVSLGTVAGVPAGALIGDLYGWRIAFYASTLLAGIAGLAVYLKLPALAPDGKNGLGQISDLMKIPAVQVGLIAAVVIFIGQFSAYTYITPFLHENAGITGAALSALLLLNGIAGFIGNATGGWFSSKNVTLSVFATVLVIGVSIMLLLLTGTNKTTASIFVIAWGVGFGMLPIALQSWLFHIAKDRIEPMQAMFVCLAQAALGSGALLGGLIVDNVGVNAALLAGSLAAFITAFIIILGYRLMMKA